MDLEKAISKHAEWKMNFRTAINKQQKLDAATIRKDNCCELGRWLHGDAKSRHGGLAAYTELLTQHAAFHVEAGKVADAINNAKFEQAAAMIESSTPFASTSSAVGTAIIRLRKAAAI
jgi:methyl-accepting chemotaxis protein